MIVRAVAIYKKSEGNYIKKDCAPNKNFFNIFSAHPLGPFESEVMPSLLKDDVRPNTLYVVAGSDRNRFHVFVQEDRDQQGDVLSVTMMVLLIESNTQLEDLGVARLMQRIWLADQEVEGCTLDKLLGDPALLIRDVKVVALQKQLDSIKQVMLKNIELVQVRGEHLEKLEKDTEVLALSAQAFNDSARQLNKGWCGNC